MDHVVRYRTEQGDDRWEEVAGLDAALKRVEELHQSSSATDVRLYRHVPLEVRTVVQVQVAGEAAATPPPTPSGSAPGAAGSSSAVEPPSGAMPLTPPPPRGQQPGQEPPQESAAPGEQSRKSGLFGR